MKRLTIKQLVITLAFTALVNSFTVAQDKVVDQIVAVVGGNIILKSDIEDMNFRQQAEGTASEGDARCEILENFMVDKLLVAEAELDTLIEVTPSEVNQQMDRLIQSIVTNMGSEQAVEDNYKKSIVDIKADLQNQDSF